MVTLDDLAGAVQARCAATETFVAALPGKLWLDRGPDVPEGDYAVLTIERDGDPEIDSGDTYTQAFTARVVAYTIQGREGATTPQAAQLALNAALSANPTVWPAMRAGAGSVLHGLARSYDGKHAPDLREGRDVFAAAGQWNILVSGGLS